MLKNLSKKNFSNVFDSKAKKQLKLGSNTYNYYDINTLDNKVSKLLFSIRGLL